MALAELRLFSRGARAAARFLTAAIDSCVVFNEPLGFLFSSFFFVRHETAQGGETRLPDCVSLFSLFIARSNSPATNRCQLIPRL